MNYTENIISKYRANGFKLTPQRLAILKCLDGNTSHPTAEDIYVEIKKTHPTVSFATVYNTLTSLKDMGALLEVTIDPDRKHFDPNTEAHHHIICTKCGRIGDIFVNYSDALALPDEAGKEFHLTGNHVDFYGLCKKCRTKGQV